MEENNNTENNFQDNIQENNGADKKKTECACRYWKEFLCVLIAAFLGGFLAIYVVTDQALYRNYKRSFIQPERMHHQMMRDLDREFARETREFEKNFNRLQRDFNPFAMPAADMGGVKIKTEIDKDGYKVIVDLKAFNGDEGRINYNVSGRKLTVFGNSSIKDKKFEQDISFSQDFLLPDNADISKIKKEKDGNKLVIEVPLK